MSQFTKKELEIINRVFGYIQDVAGESEYQVPDHVAATVESDEFADLNEKIAEILADAK